MSSLFEKRVWGLIKPAPLCKYFSGPEPAQPDRGLTPAELGAFQDESVREVVLRTYQNSPFYREKMDLAGVAPESFSGLADLGKLPFTTKDELRGKPWALLACAKKDVALIMVSTGTTGGEEIYVPSTWKDYYLHELAPGYPNLVPVGSGDICLNALPYEMSSAGLAFHKVFMDGCLSTVIPAGKGGAYSTPEKTVKMMRDLQPTVVITTPSWAVTLAEAAAAVSFDPAGLPLKLMWLTGEGCSPAFRQRVEKMWGATANFYYGSLECGGVGIECHEHFGYHICGAHVFVEIVEPETGEVLEPGEIGEIVVTCLLRYDTPIIRYRTRDLGYIDPDPCRCGVTLPRLFLRGRVVDEVVVRGISFSPYYLEEFLMRLEEVGNWYQFVNPAGAQHLTVRAELAPGVTPGPELADKLASKLEYGIGIPCEFELVPKIPRSTGKTVRVVRE
ncbi:MAG: AMP-binding protein [Firmicutes bacterium]|nr:AMP-binding protein [Bacillota bacterium]